MTKEVTYLVIENGAVINTIVWDSDLHPEFGDGIHLVKLVTEMTKGPPEGVEPDPGDPEGNAIPDITHFSHTCTDMIHGTIGHPERTPVIGDFYAPGKFIFNDDE